MAYNREKWYPQGDTIPDLNLDMKSTSDWPIDFGDGEF